MLKTAELAGFFAAHAVWSVSEGETLTPILAFETADGERRLQRLVTDELQEAVEEGQRWLAENPPSASRAVLVFDAFVTLEDGRSDALVVEAHDYGRRKASFTVALPYRPAHRSEGFAVHRPKFLEIEGPEQDIEKLVEAFFRGVDQHQKGAAVWNSHLDESR
jgi:hypothetical protein